VSRESCKFNATNESIWLNQLRRRDSRKKTPRCKKQSIYKPGDEPREETEERAKHRSGFSTLDSSAAIKGLTF
jgi:hypothetical protein